jgi:hypothetical protein
MLGVDSTRMGINWAITYFCPFPVPLVNRDSMSSGSKPRFVRRERYVRAGVSVGHSILLVLILTFGHIRESFHPAFVLLNIGPILEVRTFQLLHYVIVDMFHIPGVK